MLIRKVVVSVSTPHSPRFGHFIMRHSPAIPLRTGFEDRPVHAKFMVNKATLGQFSHSARFSPLNLPPVLHAHSFIITDGL